ncbi:MAG: hypothetical protein U9Q15_02970, partial [Patescibacteria group bacterium]|nr:hypothetical protein [Patescibacteria group bacterium]
MNNDIDQSKQMTEAHLRGEQQYLTFYTLRNPDTLYAINMAKIPDGVIKIDSEEAEIRHKSDHSCQLGMIYPGQSPRALVDLDAWLSQRKVDIRARNREKKIAIPTKKSENRHLPPEVSFSDRIDEYENICLVTFSVPGLGEKRSFAFPICKIESAIYVRGDQLKSQDSMKEKMVYVFDMDVPIYEKKEID